jgi:ABC-type branched-subunit amino acid transport system substrate-binding protein
VSDHVAAAVGGFTGYSEDFVPILQQAGIPIIGDQPLEGVDYTSPVSFPITSGVLIGYEGDVFALAHAGAKKIGLAAPDIPAATAILPTIKAVAHTAGVTYVGDTLFPQGTTDYSAFVEALQSDGADGIVVLGPSQEIVQVVKAAQGLGYGAKFAAISSAFTGQQLTEAGSVLNGTIFTAQLPPTSATGFTGLESFKAQMAAANSTGVPNSAPGNYDAASLNAWTAVYAFAEIAKLINGPITSASVLQATKTATNISLQGLAPACPAPFNQLSNPTVYFTDAENGDLVLTEKNAFNVLSGK